MYFEPLEIFLYFLLSVVISWKKQNYLAIVGLLMKAPPSANSDEGHSHRGTAA